MGAWGAGGFENDTALYWAADVSRWTMFAGRSRSWNGFGRLAGEGSCSWMPIRLGAIGGGRISWRP